MNEIPKVTPIFVDDLLLAEINRPGADQRFGVNFVAYPRPECLDFLEEVQAAIKKAEPKQYFYPRSDVHLTVLEIVSGADPETARAEFKKILPHLKGLLSGLNAPVLKAPLLRCDERAGALIFQEDEGLNRLREEISTQLLNLGVALRPRYNSTSAHLTFLRYVHPLKNGLAPLAQILEGKFNWPADPWTISEIWATSGATWYGRSGRIQKSGPYKVRA